MSGPVLFFCATSNRPGQLGRPNLHLINSERSNLVKARFWNFESDAGVYPIDHPLGLGQTNPRRRNPCTDGPVSHSFRSQSPS